MKNPYLKSSFRSQDILIFVLAFRSCRKKDLIRKIRSVSEFITSQPGRPTIAIHILPNISRSKDNQTMKFDQLVEYNMGNIFLEKFYIKYGGETIPFLRTQNWAYLWINSLKFYTICFHCMPSWGLSKCIETKLQTTCFYLMKSFFIKLREVWS